MADDLKIGVAGSLDSDKAGQSNFLPSEEDINFSRRMVESYKEAAPHGKGSTVLEAKMIDYATYAMALDLIAQAEGIAKKAMLRREKI